MNLKEKNIYKMTYIRNSKNQKIGMVVMLENGNIGYSLCTPTNVDIFDKEKGLDIATGRAEKNPIKIQDVFRIVPYSALVPVLRMIEDQSFREERKALGASK
jgi:hypothetical protein